MSQAIRTRRVSWILGGLACLVLLGTLVSYERLVQLYLRHRLERHPEELRAYALSNDANKREAIRLFANTPEGAERTGAALIQTLCGGLYPYSNLGLCSSETFEGPEGECDVEMVLARFPDGSQGFARMKITRWWDLHEWNGRVDLKIEAVECLAVFISALRGKRFLVEDDVAAPGMVLEVTDLVGELPNGLLPVVPYRATMRAEDREKLRRFSEVLLDTRRGYYRRAAQALVRLRTSEAMAVLERALALDDLDADIRAAVEEAIHDASVPPAG